MSYIKTIYKLIKKNDINSALLLLDENVNSLESKMLIFRSKELSNSIISGLLSNEETTVKKNKLIYDMLTYLSFLGSDDKKKEGGSNVLEKSILNYYHNVLLPHYFLDDLIAECIASVGSADEVVYDNIFNYFIDVGEFPKLTIVEGESGMGKTSSCIFLMGKLLDDKKYVPFYISLSKINFQLSVNGGNWIFDYLSKHYCYNYSVHSVDLIKVLILDGWDEVYSNKSLLLNSILEIINQKKFRFVIVGKKVNIGEIVGANDYKVMQLQLQKIPTLEVERIFKSKGIKLSQALLLREHIDPNVIYLGGAHKDKYCLLSTPIFLAFHLISMSSNVYNSKLKFDDRYDVIDNYICFLEKKYIHVFHDPLDKIIYYSLIDIFLPKLSFLNRNEKSDTLNLGQVSRELEMLKQSIKEGGLKGNKYFRVQNVIDEFPIVKMQFYQVCIDDLVNTLIYRLFLAKRENMDNIKISHTYIKSYFSSAYLIDLMRNFELKNNKQIIIFLEGQPRFYFMTKLYSLSRSRFFKSVLSPAYTENYKITYDILMNHYMNKEYYELLKSLFDLILIGLSEVYGGLDASKEFRTVARCNKLVSYFVQLLAFDKYHEVLEFSEYVSTSVQYKQYIYISDDN